MKNSKPLFVIIGLGLLGLAVHSLGAILVPFVAGFIGAYILDRPVSALTKYKIPRGLGALIMILAVLLILGLLMMGAVPFLHKEFTLLSQHMPKLIDHFYSLITPVLDFVSERLPPQDIEKFKAQLSGQFGNIVTWMIQFVIDILSDGLALANVVSLVFLTPVVMFYILMDWPNVTQSIEALFPKKYSARIVYHLKIIDQNLSGYARGQIRVCLILAVLYSVGLLAVGLKNAVFIGIFTGCISFIPYVGAIIGFLLSTLVHLSAGGSWNPLISIGLVFVTVQAIEGNFLTPRFVGGRIGVHPVWILFSLLAGATWFGFLGIVLALPMAAIISSVVRAIWEECR